MAETDAVCEHLHLPLQSGSDASSPPCTGATPPSATSSASPPPGAGIDDLAVTTDIIVGFPGETEDDFAATLEVAAEAEYDFAFTFVYSPRPGTEAAEATDRFVDHAVAVERMERLRVVVERSSRSAATRPGSVASRRSSSRGRRNATPAR